MIFSDCHNPSEEGQSIIFGYQPHIFTQLITMPGWHGYSVCLGLESDPGLRVTMRVSVWGFYLN